MTHIVLCRLFSPLPLSARRSDVTTSFMLSIQYSIKLCGQILSCSSEFMLGPEESVTL